MLIGKIWGVAVHLSLKSLPIRNRKIYCLYRINFGTKLDIGSDAEITNEQYLRNLCLMF